MTLSLPLAPTRTLAALLAVCVLAAGALHSQSTLMRMQQEQRALYERVRDSVLAVSVNDAATIGPPDGSIALGGDVSAQSGFVVSGGYVLCDAESILNMLRGPDDDPAELLAGLTELYAFTATGREIRLTVVGHDLRSLLLVARLPDSEALPGLALADSVTVRAGSTLMGFGNGFDVMLTDRHVGFYVGTMSDRHRLPAFGTYNRDDPGSPYRGNVLEFEGAVNPGDYGGPLLTPDGSVVGMMTGQWHLGRRLGVAVPSEQFAPAFFRIVAGEEPVAAELGVTVRDAVRGRGPTVSRIDENSPASRAGLRPEDEVLMIDGEPVRSLADVRRAIGPTYNILRREAQSDPASGLLSLFERLFGEAPAPDSGDVSYVRVPFSYGLPPGARVTLTVRRGGELLTTTIETPTGDQRALPAPDLNGTTHGRVSQARARRGAAAADSVVQVIVDRDRRPPAGMGGVFGALFELPGFGAPDQAFPDVAIGPFSGIIVGSNGEILVSDSIFGHDAADGVDPLSRRSLRTIHVVLADGRTFEAWVRGRDADSGLALLKIDASDLPAVRFTAAGAGAGEAVNPIRGNAISVITRSLKHTGHGTSVGIVSAASREFDQAFQIDGRVGSCHQGGLVIDHASGKPLGVVVMRHSHGQELGQGSGVAYAVHGAAIAAALPVLRDGQFRRPSETPTLGFLLGAASADAPEAPAGVIVTWVDPQSPAARAGLKIGDRVTAINGVEVREPSDAASLVARRRVGDSVTLDVVRTAPSASPEDGPKHLQVTYRLQARRSGS